MLYMLYMYMYMYIPASGLPQSLSSHAGRHTQLARTHTQPHAPTPAAGLTRGSGKAPLKLSYWMGFRPAWQKFSKVSALGQLLYKDHNREYFSECVPRG